MPETEPEINLVDLYPSGITLPEPETGESYAVFRVKGLDESGLHAFLRLVPSLGKSMARSKMKIDDVNRVNALTEAIIGALGDGRLDPLEIGAILLLLRKFMK